MQTAPSRFDDSSVAGKSVALVGSAPLLKGPAVEGVPVNCMLDRHPLSLNEAIETVASLSVTLKEMGTFMPMTLAEEGFIAGEVSKAKWSARQTAAAFEYVIKTKTWIAPGDNRPRIFPGDLFSAKLPRVYGQPWYLQRSQAEKQYIAQYWCPGFDKPVFGWTFELDGLDDQLVRVKFKRVTGELPPAPEPLGEEVTSLISVTRDLLKAKAESAEVVARHDAERKEWIYERGRLLRENELLESQLANVRTERDDLISELERLRAELAMSNRASSRENIAAATEGAAPPDAEGDSTTRNQQPNTH